MDVMSLKLSPRSVTGKKVKALRRHGIVPVHVYGADVSPMALQVEAPVLRRVLPRVGTNIPLSVEIEGEQGGHVCFVREVQRHPATEDVLHVDLMRVDVTREMRAEIPVVLVGFAPAVRRLGGTLIQPLHSILVESLPMRLPASIPVDISVLEDFEKAIHVSDVTVSEDVKVLTDPEDLIVRVSPPRVEAVEAPEAAAEATPEAAEEEEEAQP